jgi:hypothetical protein
MVVKKREGEGMRIKKNSKRERERETEIGVRESKLERNREGGSERE